MSTSCEHCRGDSRVVETREVAARTGRQHGHVRTRTKLRRRECLRCRWRWRTVEIIVDGRPRP